MAGRKRSVVVAVAAVVVAGVLDTDGAAAPPAPGAPATLGQLAWIAGDWQGEVGPGALSQEVWAAPAGDCMMGMWRLVVDGRVQLFEALSITDEGGGPVLRLRHFGRDGVGWEERDRPLTLRAEEVGDGLAAFAGAGRSGLLRIVYRKSGDDALTVTVEKGTDSERYEFRRAGAWRGEIARPAAALEPAQRP